MSSDSESDEGVQVRVSLKLAASVQDRSLEVPTEPIAVPAEIGRKGLSAVLNHLLGRAVKKVRDDDDEDSDESGDEDEDESKLPPLPFEFIVSGGDNRLLRMGVEKEARRHGISLEQAIVITYFPAAQVPELNDDTEETPDWVGALASQKTTVISGCYDGTLHVYNQQTGEEEALSKEASSTAGSGPIKALATAELDDAIVIAAGSLEHSLQLYKYASTSLSLFGNCVPTEKSAAVTSLDFSITSNQQLLASGDDMGTISLWDLDVESAVNTKKQKTDSTKGATVQEFQAQVVLESAHSQLVSGLSWSRSGSSSPSHLISGSWDHSIKLWDTSRQDCLMTLNGSRVVTCLDTSYHSEGVVATGHPDCTIRLWDMRVRAEGDKSATMGVSDTTFRPSHKAWISAVQWSPTTAYHLASASHDGSVKLWDIRSSNPLHTVRVVEKGQKALSLTWMWEKDEMEQPYLFAGGTDCTIKQIHF
eukprot:Nitzschia sp. Nitz4//scaffold56_size114212//80488//81918//NITZ4_003960-RA/size114212-processed-gene-0.72-mRNA-1//-1//CDS//3329554736//4577//frame0